MSQTLTPTRVALPSTPLAVPVFFRVLVGVRVFGVRVLGVRVLGVRVNFEHYVQSPLSA